MCVGLGRAERVRQIPSFIVTRGPRSLGRGLPSRVCEKRRLGSMGVGRVHPWVLVTHAASRRSLRGPPSIVNPVPPTPCITVAPCKIRGTSLEEMAH